MRVPEQEQWGRPADSIDPFDQGYLNYDRVFHSEKQTCHTEL